MTDGAIMAARGLNFSLRDLIKPLGFTVLLAVLSCIYYLRKEPKFVLCLVALLHLVMFSWSYMVFTYAVTTLNRPLIDQTLVFWDRLMGVHVPDIIAWSRSHTTLNTLLNVSYNTLLIQTGVTVAVLGLSNEKPQLESFQLQLMIGALMAGVLFLLFPAVGPFEVYGFEPDEGQVRFMEHFFQLRNGERLTVTDKEPEGLITFPSFHTTWPILLALAFRHRPIVFTFSAMLNAAVIVSTVTSGWHYVTDVLAGLLLAVVTVALTKWIEMRLAVSSQSGGPKEPQSPSAVSAQV